METLHGHMEQIEVTQELIIQEIELEKALQTTLRQEEESLRLQSRNLWLISGDQNTNFFQNQCKERQRRNTIRELKKDDETSTTDQAEIINEVRVFFLICIIIKGSPSRGYGRNGQRHSPSCKT